MTWTSDLKHIDDLADELQIENGISLLNYHLYQSWTLDTDYATGEDDCGLKNVGNHYDPYFAVRWASGGVLLVFLLPLIAHTTGHLLFQKLVRPRFRQFRQNLQGHWS